MKIERTIGKADRRRVQKPASIPTNKTSAEALKKELDGWVACRNVWNHEDWLKLLSELRTKGYNDLIDTPKGQDAIGLYLEARK